MQILLTFLSSCVAPTFQPSYSRLLWDLSWFCTDTAPSWLLLSWFGTWTRLEPVSCDVFAVLLTSIVWLFTIVFFSVPLLPIHTVGTRLPLAGQPSPAASAQYYRILLELTWSRRFFSLTISKTWQLTFFTFAILQHAVDILNLSFLNVVVTRRQRMYDIAAPDRLQIAIALATRCT